jgi:hypothetical protein
LKVLKQGPEIPPRYARADQEDRNNESQTQNSTPLP